MAGPDAAFEALADPAHLPDLVPIIEFVDAVAIGGDEDADADLAGRDGAPEAGFVADRRTRTITWGRPEHDYGGSISVVESTASTANVTVRLRTRADADTAAVTAIFEQAIANIRRHVMRR